MQIQRFFFLPAPIHRVTWAEFTAYTIGKPWELMISLLQTSLMTAVYPSIQREVLLTVWFWAPLLHCQGYCDVGQGKSSVWREKFTLWQVLQKIECESKPHYFSTLSKAADRDSADHHLKLDFSHWIRERSLNRLECRGPLVQPSAQSKVSAVVWQSTQGFVQLGLKPLNTEMSKTLLGNLVPARLSSWEKGPDL